MTVADRARTAARRARAALGGPPAPTPVPPPPDLDWWLQTYAGAELARLDAACAGAGPEAYARFAALDDDVWAALLSREHTAWPNILALLPDLPEPALQRIWVGRSGLAMAAQAGAFTAKLKAIQRRHGAVALNDARVLDFGCGWGRLTRFLARDVGPGRLYGCDPVEAMVDLCGVHRVPARIARSAPRPSALPFDESFDLVFAYSVFTHLSEAAHTACLAALRDALAPGGLAVVTVRPPAYLRAPDAHRLAAAVPGDPLAAFAGSRYAFVPHPPDPAFPAFPGEEPDYGEAVVSMPYIRERWTEWFELVEADLFLDDLHQVPIVLRRPA